MSDNFRFTPASIEAFKRTARDVQRAYPLGLQQSQEILAKVYGYPHLHALQEHLKGDPAPGPYPSTMDAAECALARLSAQSRFHQIAAVPASGRIDIHDLWIIEEPETRKAAMDYQAMIDSYVDGSARAERTLATSEYVVFDDRRPDRTTVLSSIMGPRHREGVFCLTQRGQAVYEAMRWLNSQERETSPGSKERDRSIRAMARLIDRYPNHPYPLANSLSLSASFDAEDSDQPSMDPELAAELWPKFQKCRGMFDAIMPKGFSGDIEPKLAGSGVANHEYIALLYWGAVVAAALGLHRDALAWARRCVRFHDRDSFGARLLIKQLAR